MELERNEEKLLKKLKQVGLTETMEPFSFRDRVPHLVLTRRRVKKRVVFEDFIVYSLMTKLKWMRRLHDKGLIEIDLSDKWNPRAKFTPLGLEMIK